MRAAELRAVVESTVGPLEEGLLEEQHFTEFLGTRLQLRYSCCGLATAALQRYLMAYHGVETERYILDLPEVSVSAQTRHVFLRHDRSMTIDPAYSQFFEYAGLSAVDICERPELHGVYPETKIAVIEDVDLDRFIADFAGRALSGSRRVATALGWRLPPDKLSFEEMERLCRGVWRPSHVKRFEVAGGTAMAAAASRIAERIAASQA